MSLKDASTSNTTGELYERYNEISGRPTVKDHTVKEKIFKSFQRTLDNWLPRDRSLKILDIACGEGTLLTFLKEKGYKNLAGFDLSEQNVGICHELGLTFVQRFNAEQLNKFRGAEKYDVIFALDILEHLPKQSATQFLKQIREKLQPNGCLVIQTPNMGSVFSCLCRYNDLSHEFGVTEHTLLHLLLIAGFEANKVEIKPQWSASTLLGRFKETYLCLLHQLIFIAEGAGRPKIPTKNLLARAYRS
ncbi:MAG: class I SAM-dependent methyltransferase [Mojavia pulchra JT2-VF2]|jgi:2-polyprenyl-3-methyl-5-hydroxy-6-metoxy-1,4-benzoquinol methylase|uniref:Class I SAM-dependent methyltransferase n=1 Tax=Mojavia pulchra JT2-VF2 TaxID=287848 RepID=A0A951UFB8_9NOST|nr:class I SAM-dependent methyltransferase [Mojavia pulchra JT2-VF2]